MTRIIIHTIFLKYLQEFADETPFPNKGVFLLATIKRSNLVPPPPLRHEKKILIPQDVGASWLSGWRAGLNILCPRGTGLIPVVARYLIWDRGQWRDSVSSPTINPDLNR